ncbi:MAG: hypothetical protein ACLQVM_27325 [Terriglobia bacterium]
MSASQDSTATDVSTAGSAPLVAAAFSALYLFTRHVRGVILPKHTKMDITFDQPFRCTIEDASGTSPEAPDHVKTTD